MAALEALSYSRVPEPISISTERVANIPSHPIGAKTPADEAIDFFESPVDHTGEPIRVYELALDADGGPNKDRSVRVVSRGSHAFFIIGPVYPPSATCRPIYLACLNRCRNTCVKTWDLQD
jgi:hypothetical protein